MKERLQKLWIEKSFAALVGVFSALALCVQEQKFIAVFAVVIRFYFGTQYEKAGGQR